MERLVVESIVILKLRSLHLSYCFQTTMTKWLESLPNFLNIASSEDIFSGKPPFISSMSSKYFGTKYKEPCFSFLFEMKRIRWDARFPGIDIFIFTRVGVIHEKEAAAAISKEKAAALKDERERVCVYVRERERERELPHPMSPRRLFGSTKAPDRQAFFLRYC